MAGVLLPEFKNASTWLEEGANKLNTQVQEQFNEDGVHYELDPSYHIGAISDFYNIYEVAQKTIRLINFLPIIWSHYVKLQSLSWISLTLTIQWIISMIPGQHVYQRAY